LSGTRPVPIGLLSGQALAECLIGCLLLLPLWWFMQRWIEGESQRAALQSQVRVAAFGESLAPGRGAASASAGTRGPLEVQVVRSATPALAGEIEAAAFTLLMPVSALSPGRVDLRRDGWIRAEVSVEPPAHSFWRRGAQRWRESLTLLTDDWSAYGPRDVERRTQTLLPTTPVEWLLDALDAVQGAVRALEPALIHTCARRIDPEIVPEDRLTAGARPTTPMRALSGWRPRC
jgi:hypothetical protein